MKDINNTLEALEEIPPGTWVRWCGVPTRVIARAWGWTLIYSHTNMAFGITADYIAYDGSRGMLAPLMIHNDEAALAWFETILTSLREHWKAVLTDEKEGDTVIIDGDAFTIAPETASPNFLRGFGGRRFILQDLHSGETITTTNLWHRGSVPKELKAVNTHKFLNEG